MSVEFWLNLTLAIGSLLLALAIIRSWKRGIIRDWRAKSLRQRLIPPIQSLLSSLASSDNELRWQELSFFRQREQVEELYRKSSPLSHEEKVGLAKFLTAISSLQAKAQVDISNIRSEREEALLNGQRIIQDMHEMGL